MSSRFKDLITVLISDICPFLVQASRIVTYTLRFVSLKLSILTSRILVCAYRSNYYDVVLPQIYSFKN